MTPLNLCAQVFGVGPSIFVWRHNFQWRRTWEVTWRYAHYEGLDYDITVQWL